MSIEGVGIVERQRDFLGRISKLTTPVGDVTYAYRPLRTK